MVKVVMDKDSWYSYHSVATLDTFLDGGDEWTEESIRETFGDNCIKEVDARDYREYVEARKRYEMAIERLKG